MKKMAIKKMNSSIAQASCDNISSVDEQYKTKASIPIFNIVYCIIYSYPLAMLQQFIPVWLHNTILILGLLSLSLTLLSLIFKFIKPPYKLHPRYGGGWAVVTGGTDGIGYGFCEELAKMGFNICVVSRNREKVEAVCEGLRGKWAVNTKGIVADFGACFEKGFFQRIAKQIEELDVSVLVNNVGVICEARPFFEHSPEEIKNEITINTVPVSMMTKILLPQMLKRQKRSAIISLSSYSILMRLKHSANYCATKHFDDIFSRGLQLENRDKIDFLSVRPGFVTTNMTGNTTSLIHVNRNQCALGALRALGRYSHYAGSWRHQFFEFATCLVSERLRDFLNGEVWIFIEKKFQKAKEGQKKKL